MFRLIAGLSLGVLLGAGTASTRAATMDFESLPSGTLLGLAGGYGPGDPVLVENGIIMSVDTFHLGSFQGFFEAEIGGRYGNQFPGNVLQLDNLVARFDFSGVGFPVDLVTFEFAEFGGAANFAVNGGPLHELASMSDIPPNPLPGISVTFGGGGGATAGTTTVSVTGLVDSLVLGGQELVIDNIVVVPEPISILLWATGISGLLVWKRPRKTGKT